MPPGSLLPSKALLKEELLRVLGADLAARERAYRSALEAATHQEAKPENDKDTRALEQSYLARGEAARVEELRAGFAEVQALAVAAFDADGPARLGAVVVTEEGDQRTVFFIAPHGGGARLASDTVQVVTPKSPLGRALLGAKAGEECEVTLAGKLRALAVIAVS
ncbi:MAG TPA: GreA/GreB family elongation factor [Polyangiaceae bacterium]|nr:GreA/GreB family elongation factor [Polyangiaceae bacterium]